MTPAKIVGSFTLGSAPWTIKLDSDVEEQCRWENNLPLCTVTLTDTFDGVPFNYQFIEKNLWEAILRTIIIDSMYYGEIMSRPLLISFSSLFYQAISTLTLTDWEGTFQLGGIEYYVTVDNPRCHKEGKYGTCYGYQKKILLSTESKDKQPCPEGFIWQTFYHELFHAIAREMGQEDTDLNSERFVNVLSYFIHEIRQSLVINFPDK